jgi:hypothetical protein
MKILLISPAYPPHPEVGAVRAGNLVRTFLEAGHDVTLLTEQLAGVEYPALSTPGNLRVVPVNVGTPYAKRLHALLPSRQRPVASLDPDALERGPGDSASSGVRSRNPLKQAVLALLSLPDREQHMVLPFIRRGREVLRAEAFELLYSTAPPFSAHLAGLWLHRRTGVPWVAEFRDPWNYIGLPRAAAKHFLSRRLDSLLEHRVLRSADAIVTVTEAARELMIGRLPATQSGKVLLARNGIPDWPGDEPAPASIAGQPGPFTMVYAGSLHMGRNPVRFFQGLSRFINQHGVPPSGLQVRFVGRCHEFRGIPLAGLLDQLGLKPYVTLEGLLPHDQVRTLLWNADVLLMFAQHQPLQVPNKLYEYLAVGAPIMAFVDQEGESARLLSTVPGAELLFEPDAAQVAESLARLFARRAARANGGRPRHQPDRNLRTSVQLGALVAELEARFGSRTGRPSRAALLHSLSGL